MHISGIKHYLTPKTYLFALMALTGVLLATFLSSHNVYAAAKSATTNIAQNYSWSDRQTISVSGGSVKSGQSIRIANPNSNQLTSASGNIQMSQVLTYEDCFLWICNERKETTECFVAITVTFSGLNSGTISAKAGVYANSSGSSGPPECHQNVIDSYNGKRINITGNRPSDGSSTTETDNQKIVFFNVKTDLKASSAPDDIKLLVTGDGSKRLTATKNTLSGNVTFSVSEPFEPGEYTVRLAEDYDGIEVSAKKFTKVKFEQSTVNLGSGEGFANRQVRVKVVVKTQDPSARTYGPLKLNLLDSDDKIITSGETDSFKADAVTQGSLNERIINLRGNLDDVNPGKYKVCVASTSLCKSITKEASKFLEIELEVSGDQLASELSASDDSTSACVVDGIGWILCPVINAMAGMTDATFGLVSAFMRVEPLGFATDNPMYQAWAIMRNIANVAFTIAFLIIVFSQLTSIGISNYGVKKMLPRLVIAAILVNMSYFICALAVDVSNILGYSVQNVLTNLSDTVGGAKNTLTEEWGSIATSVLSLGAIGAAGVIGVTVFSSMSIWAMLAGLLPLLISALFALIIAFLVLLARQAFIIILIVIAPLAFVAYLLPNTQDLFKKWRVFFVTLLALFPMMALVFGGSVLASTIMRQGAIVSMGSDQPATATVGFFVYLGSVAVLAIPFFITPLLIKLSSGVLNRFAGFINNPHKGPFDRMRKGAERIRDNARNNSYAQKLSGNRRMLSFGARRRNRKALYDKSITNSVQAAEAGAVFSDQKADNLAMRAANANQLAGTLEAEHKAEFEAQKDSVLDYRQKLADQKIKARGLSDQASFDESKTNARPIPANSPIAEQIKEAQRSQRAIDVSNSQIRMAGDVSRQELAKALEEDGVLAVQMGGVAGQRGAERVKAEAQFTLQKAVMEEVDAERTQVASIADAAQLTAEYNKASSVARRAAIAERLITVGNPANYQNIVNTIGANTNTDAESVVLRKTVAKSLSDNMQLLKASDIDAVATGTLTTRTTGANTLQGTVGDNVKSGVLSQEKMVIESNDNLKYAWSVTDANGRQKLTTTATELIANDVLRGKIKHNGDVITRISSGQNP